MTYNIELRTPVVRVLGVDSFDIYKHEYAFEFHNLEKVKKLISINYSDANNHLYNSYVIDDRSYTVLSFYSRIKELKKIVLE